LLCVGGACEQDVGVRAGRRVADAAFFVAKIGVFVQIETDGREKGDDLVIVRDEEREEGETIWRFDALAFVSWAFRECYTGAFGKVYIIRAPRDSSVKT